MYICIPHENIKGTADVIILIASKLLNHNIRLGDSSDVTITTVIVKNDSGHVYLTLPCLNIPTAT